MSARAAKSLGCYALVLCSAACQPAPAAELPAPVAAAPVQQAPVIVPPAVAPPPASVTPAVDAGKTEPAPIAVDAGAVPAVLNDAGSAPEGPEVVAEPSDEAAYIFDQTTVRSYNLVIAQADLITLNSNPEAEMYVPGMLELEGKTYGPLSVRYKGSVGAWRPPCVLSPGNNLPKYGKCSIKVDFSKPDGTAKFFGVEKLNFHSMNPDDSMLRERLGYAMFREMGVASPRTAHARVLINGVLEGLFIVVENIDERFTRSRFSEGGRGNLYKEIWPMFGEASMYITALENNSSQATAAGVQKMLDFKAAIDDSAEAAEAFLDRDYMLRYMAVDRVIINDDGIFHWWCEYGAQGNNTGQYGNHNYYWYEATAAERMWLIPWDLDTSFDGLAENRIELQWDKPAACMCTMNSVGTVEWPASCDQLTKYMATWSAPYEAMVDAFIAGPFAAPAVDAKLDAWATQIEPYVAEASGWNSAPTSAAWKRAVTQLKATISSARVHRGYAY